MNVPYRVVIVLILISLAAGAYIEHKYVGAVKSTDETTTSNNIITKIKEKQNKDGTIEKDITIIDKSKKEEKITVTTMPPSWLIQGGIGLDKGLTTVYTVSLSKRVLGPIYLGIWGSTQQALGASIGLQF